MITIKKIEGFDAVEVAAINRAIELLNGLIPSEEFKSRLLALRMDRTQGYSNAEIYEMLLRDVALDIYRWEPSRASSSALAQTGNDRIGIRSCALNRSDAEIAATILHERTHLSDMSFTHPYFRFMRSGREVPYAIDRLTTVMLQEEVLV